MQKKLIALAVAGLVSGAAFAQSNVVIYGIIDAGVTYGSSHTTTYDPGTGLKNTPKSRSAIDSGGWDSSRIGFKGTEDLGNGMSASFETQFRPRTDYRSDGFALNKQILQLEGKSWGAVRLGTFGSVHDDINGYSEVQSFGYANSVLDIIVDGDDYNSLQYVSPNMSGLQFKLGVSGNDEDYDEANGGKEVNSRGYSGLVSYVNGPIKAAASYGQKKYDGDKQKEWLVSGSYNFGPVILGAGYDQTTFDGYAGGKHGVIISDGDRKAWRVNLGAPIGTNNVVALSYSQVKYNPDNARDLKAKGYGLSFHHAMSKRTNLYASYGKVSQSDNSAAYLGYESRFKVGIRHLF